MVYRGGILGRWSQRSSDVWFQAVMLLGIFSAGWLACHPQVAWADSVTSVVTHAGVSGESLTWLLPCGRWSSSMGTVLTVTEPVGGLFGGITGYTSNIMTTLRLAVPDLCLQCAQVLWSSTIAFTQMASSVSPLASCGHWMDEAVAALWYGSDGSGGLVHAGILAILLIGGFVTWLTAAAFHWGGQNGWSGARRFLSTCSCLAVCMVMATGALSSTSSQPGVMSPWWITRSLSNAVTTVVNHVSLQNVVTSSTSDLMSSSTNQTAAWNHGIQIEGNCQNYVHAMQQQYEKAASSQSSALLLAVNADWEETALRDWVTLQFGQPTYSGSVLVHRDTAENAQLAYCHILEAEAGTSPSEQNQLTRSEYGGGMYNPTPVAQNMLFHTSGWKQPMSETVNRTASGGLFTGTMAKPGSTWDPRSPSFRLDRLGIFWMTCTGGNGQLSTGSGWNNLISSLGRPITPKVTGSGGNLLRPAGSNPLVTNLLEKSKRSQVQSTPALCHALLTSSHPLLSSLLRQSAVPYSLPSGQESSYAAAHAAYVAWRFDLPNVAGTWTAAGSTPAVSGVDRQQGAVNGVNWSTVSSSQLPAAVAVKTTLRHVYGDDTNYGAGGAVASCVAGLVALLVFGGFAFVDILAKVGLCLLCLFLLFSFLMQAVPWGRVMRHAVSQWCLLAFSLLCVGMLVGVLGSVTCMVDSMMSLALSQTAGRFGGEFLFLMSCAISPLLSVLLVEVFCTRVCHVKNPFRPRHLVSMVMGADLASTVLRLPQHMRSSVARLQDHVSSWELPHGPSSVGSSAVASSVWEGAHHASSSPLVALADASNLSSSRLASTVSISSDGRNGHADSNGIVSLSRASETSLHAISPSDLAASSVLSSGERRFRRLVDWSVGDANSSIPWEELPVSSRRGQIARLERQSLTPTESRDPLSPQSMNTVRTVPLLQRMHHIARVLREDPQSRHLVRVAAATGIKAAGTGVLLSSPMLAPLGLLYAGRELSHRSTWKNIATMAAPVHTVGRAVVESAHHGIQRTQERFQAAAMARSVAHTMGVSSCDPVMRSYRHWLTTDIDFRLHSEQPREESWHPSAAAIATQQHRVALRAMREHQQHVDKEQQEQRVIVAAQEEKLFHDRQIGYAVYRQAERVMQVTGQPIEESIRQVLRQRHVPEEGTVHQVARATARLAMQEEATDDHTTSAIDTIGKRESSSGVTDTRIS